MQLSRVPDAAAPGTLQGGAAGTAPPPSLRTITASPPLELTAAHCGLNRSGTYAAVAGSALEDPEISRVVVIDLANCRPAPGSPASGGAARHDLCDAVVLDAELFASRPGLRVLQVGWHPDSDAHLAVLTSGEPGACCRCRPPVARGDGAAGWGGEGRVRLGHPWPAVSAAGRLCCTGCPSPSPS